MALDPAARRPAALTVANPCELSPLDLAANTMFGREPRTPLPPVAPGTSLFDLVDVLVAEAAADGPLFIALSGGADSSTQLALGTAATRRLGLPDPIPITLRYERFPGPENEAQERVIKHLGLKDWERIPIEDELEVTGPYARLSMEKVGVTFPTNVFLLLPILERARPGTLMFGVGTTDFHVYWHWSRISDVLNRRRRPYRSDLPYLAFAALPPVLRRPFIRRARPRPPMMWLRPDARKEAERLWYAEAAAVPVRHDEAIHRQRTHRCFTGSRRALEAAAAAIGTRLVLPYWDPRFLAASIADGGRWGDGEKAASMLRSVGDLLPADILTRRERAPVREVLFGESARDWVRDWSGAGLPFDILDHEVLRRVWSAPDVDWRTSGLLMLAIHGAAPKPGGKPHADPVISAP